MLDWTFIRSKREVARSIDSSDEPGEDISPASALGHLHRAPTLLYVTRDGLRRTRKDLYKASRKKHPQFYPGVAHDAAIKSGDQVDTPFGPGVVLRYRAHDAIYELKLLGFPARAYVDARGVRLVGPSSSSMLDSLSLGTTFASILSRLTLSRTGSTSLEAGQKVLSKFGEGAVVRVRADMIVEVQLDVWHGVLFVHVSDLETEVRALVPATTERKESTFASLLKKFTISTPKVKRHTVHTPFGPGHMIEVREHDKMNVVELEWGGKLFAPSDFFGSTDPVESQSTSFGGRLRSLISIPSFGMGKSLKAVSPKYSELLGAIGDEIATPFGSGIIIGWRNANVVVVQLSFGVAYIPITEVQGQEKDQPDTAFHGYLTDGDSATESKSITRPRSLSESYETIKYLTTTKLYGLFFPEKGLFKRGQAVWTCFGSAEVVQFRRKDRMYELNMAAFKAVVFIRQEQVTAEPILKRITSQDKVESMTQDAGDNETAIPLGHTSFSWMSQGDIPMGHTAFSWRGSC